MSPSTSTLNAPTIDFTGSSIECNDGQRGDALSYFFDADTRALIPYATLANVDDEVACMLDAGTAGDAQLNITPVYLGPSRSRFRLTNSGEAGDAKEYSSLVVSFAQHQSLAKPKDKLSWSATSFKQRRRVDRCRDDHRPTRFDAHRNRRSEMHHAASGPLQNGGNNTATSHG